MKNLKLNFVFLSVLAILISSSCSRRVLDFTLISSKNVDLTKGATFKRGKPRVEGSDKVHIILFFPTGIVNLKEALDKAIESAPGCVALLDGVVIYKAWYIPLIYGQQKAIIEGTPLIDPSLATNYLEKPGFKKIRIDKNGEIESIEKISTTEYFAQKTKLIKESERKKIKN